MKLRVEDFNFLLETSNLQCTILIITCSWKSLLQEKYPLVSRGIVSSTQMKGVRKQNELTIIARYTMMSWEVEHARCLCNLCALTSKLCSLRYVLNIIAFGTCLLRWQIGYVH